jgi:hypothetical protein
VNTYSGATVVEEGAFTVTGSILNTSGITVGESATLELARATGSATAASLVIDNAGTLLISAGTQTVGVITGSGTTQVDAGASLTAISIVQGTLSIGSFDAAAKQASPKVIDAANISQVPEPGTLVMLLAVAMGLTFCSWFKNKR